MVKYSLLLLNFFGVFSFFHFSDNGVRISDNTPSMMQPGQNQEITINIDKGEIDLYAKLVLTLPEGFTAVKGNTHGSMFTFEGNRAKFTWSDMPEEENISISYFLNTGESMFGDYTISGVFSYITENQRVDYDLQDKTIAVGIEKVQPELTAQAETQSGEMTCIRSIHQLNSSEFTVSLDIKNSSMLDFVKIMEEIPNGYEISNVEDGGAVTTISNNEMKFVWFEAPKAKDFMVSYKLTRTLAGASLAKLSGNLVYNKDDVPIELVVYYDNPFTEDIAVAEPENTEINNPSATSVPNPETGISYKVQIAAGHKGIIKNYFQKKYTFTDSFDIEKHSGWNKYTTGSFEEYKNARNGRERIDDNYNFDGPFVTAYNEGVRITVQEALMICNQKWYQ